MTRAYIGLGANLGERETTIRSALVRLDRTAGVSVSAVSSLRETEPVGLLDQPPFLNGVAVVETTLAPRELLDALLEIERALGRTRDGPRYGPRAIDLDLLVYADVVVDEPGLAVPHPRLHERRFAVEPLAEVEPELVVPRRGSVAAMLARLEATTLRP